MILGRWVEDPEAWRKLFGLTWSTPVEIYGSVQVSSMCERYQLVVVMLINSSLRQSLVAHSGSASSGVDACKHVILDRLQQVMGWQ